MKSGVVATSSAATPDGMRFSATPTSEFASISSDPTMAAVRNCGHVTPAAPWTCATASMMRPASPNRAADSRNGGIVSIATLIPR